MPSRGRNNWILFLHIQLFKDKKIQINFKYKITELYRQFMIMVSIVKNYNDLNV